MPFLLLAGLAAFVRSTFAHGGLANYTVGDTWYRGNSYDPSTSPSDQLNQPWLTQRQWTTIDPLFSASSPYLACNYPGTAPPSYIPIPAGDILTAVYWFWLHPVGPMSVWLSPCSGDCREEDVTRSKWFKIWEAGLLEGPNLELGTWYQKRFQRWDGGPAMWPVRIPRGLKAGLYMVRHEILSIHVAGRPQFYMQCAHLNVTGGGDVMVPEGWLRRFPGAYDEDDESVLIDIYAPENANRTEYTVPGGPIWEGLGEIELWPE
ncbi:hypothetical protein VTJ49DRAFT_6403 [Mycothermus thermophilus]|uniref:lytic cellulose monooxygenase (C4-dehydrogenating) n=1 Tax=Humicola insolens TaxID=85995 RepID=A0ABR3VQ26_HUMIN